MVQDEKDSIPDHQKSIKGMGRNPYKSMHPVAEKGIE